MDERPQLLTVEQARRRLCVARSTLYQLIAADELQTVKIGRARRVVLHSLVNYVERRLIEASA
jgi:excisionase family DNA binding protein